MSDYTSSQQCSFCEKNEEEINQLIQGSHALICDECVQVCGEVLKNPSSEPKKDVDAIASSTLQACSFCEKNKASVDKLIKGPNAFICNECVHDFLDKFHHVLSKQNVVTKKFLSIPTPHQLKDHFDRFVIGQDHAKKTLAVAAYNHYKRVNLLKEESNDLKNTPEAVEILKSNILLLGPTGSGKTLLAQALADKLQLPFAIVDATTFTEAGYVGEDVENILQRLLQASDNDIEQAQLGIVYLDEIDKLSRRSDNPSITRDVSGEGVQQALLKLLEGTVASVPLQGSRKHPHQETVSVDTKNVLFICGGTFEGLEKIIRERNERAGIGFSATIRDPSSAQESVKNLADSLETQDLVKFGLIPELIGRLPVISSLEELTETQLVQVLVQPKNALLKQYSKLFGLNHVELEFDEEALIAVAKKSLTFKTGARGLRAILEKLLLNLMYDIPSQHNIAKVTITKACVLGQNEPILVYKDSSAPPQGGEKIVHQ